MHSHTHTLTHYTSIDESPRRCRTGTLLSGLPLLWRQQEGKRRARPWREKQQLGQRQEGLGVDLALSYDGTGHARPLRGFRWLDLRGVSMCVCVFVCVSYKQCHVSPLYTIACRIILISSFYIQSHLHSASRLRSGSNGVTVYLP